VGVDEARTPVCTVGARAERGPRTRVRRVPERSPPSTRRASRRRPLLPMGVSSTTVRRADGRTHAQPHRVGACGQSPTARVGRTADSVSGGAAASGQKTELSR
jgi:hypothetical protein